MMRILLWKEILLLIKKKITVTDFEAANNTAAIVTATNAANDNAFE